MRYLFILILLGFYVVVIHSRPSQTEDTNESQEEAEYEGGNGPSDDGTLEDSGFGEEESNNQDLDQNQRLWELNRNNYLQKNLADDQESRTSSDVNPDFKFSRTRDVRNDNKFDEASVNLNDEFQSYSKRRRYIENNDADDQLEAAHLINRDIKNFKTKRMHNNIILDGPSNKRTLESKKAHIEEGDMLFENSQDQMSKVDKNDYNFNEPLDVNQRSSYPKQYYNQMQSNNGAMADVNSRNNEYLYFNRDRRETMKSNHGDTESVSNVETGNENLERSDNENEEMVIKKHIKKMTGDELQQLLNSLSEEKRALLKKIIDDVDTSEKVYDSVNKREITKKAGAVEDNGYIETGQSESSKIEGGSAAINIDTTVLSTSLDAEATEANKQTENQQDTTVITNQKSSNSESKVNLKCDIENDSEKSDNSLAPSKNQAEMAANEQIASKNENKRETNPKDTVKSVEDPKMLGNEYTKENKDDESYFSPQNEDLSQFLDDIDQSRFYDSSKIYKREVENESELDSKLKALEESFPNSDAYDESGPYSGPLIRVKRKNAEQLMKKRSVAVLPDAKVRYCPYKAESNDDDTDEGNEFDDDGFYDPTPNFVSYDNKNAAVNSEKTGRETASCKIDQSKSPVSSGASGGTMNIGSDTDNVLSGVEGVDENLMFSSGTRNRRKTEGAFVEHVDGNNLFQSAQRKSPDGEIKSTSNSDIDIPNYQDNDSFGGYPRNYEGDLGRYKRIRRVKQSHVSEAPSNL